MNTIEKGSLNVGDKIEINSGCATITPKIEWTLCSERMPPDDLVISRIGGENEDVFRVLGSLVRGEYNRWKNFSDVPVYWTEFTKEKWEFLNR